MLSVLRFATMLLVAFTLPVTAVAQSRSSLDSPTCMISPDVPLAARIDKDYSHELFIWMWYAYGFEGARQNSRWTNRQRSFAECFEKEAQGKCGWKPDRKTVKELKRNRTDRWDKNPLKKVFTDRPPPEAVEFAMRSLGTCFGDDPSLPQVYELGLVQDAFSMDACKDLAVHISSAKYNPANYPPEFQELQTWAIALRHYMTPPNATEPVKACRVVPEVGLPILESYAQRAAAAQQAAEQKRLAYENRPIAERIKGLDAYDIAYSLVFRTNSGEHMPTRPLPEGAMEWWKEYDWRVAAGYIEPALPAAVMDWALEQPLDRFEAVEDPWDKKVRTEYYKMAEFVWGQRLTSQMNKLAPNESRTNVKEGCSILLSTVRTDIFYGRASKSTPGRALFYDFVSKAPDKLTWSLCAETPTSIFLDAKARYEKKLADEAYAAANPPAPSEWDQILKRLNDYANQPSSNSAPYRAPTTRCYNTGTTESGLTNRVCFEN